MPELAPDVLAAYARPGPARALYLRLRLHRGGLEDLAACFPPGGLVVDLGCGDGLLAHCVVRLVLGARVLAVDWDAGRVRRLAGSARGLPIEAVCARMEDVLLPPCDGVALVDVLHYLEAPAQEALLDRVAAALRPGGVLVLREIDADAGWRFRWNLLHERLFRTLGWTRASWGRLRPLAAWRRLLEARGLRVEVLPRKGRSPYADRTLVARRP